ncbi:MAG: T9SS type A sorting domain-containing protein, partial [Ignavibacteriaceae bacterium]
YPYPLPDYPLGVFAAQNNDATVVLVGWGKIFDKINESTTDVKNEGKQPETFKLFQNYPNPFNPTTRIQYSIASKQFVSLRVYDSLGKEVKILVNAERPAGTYEVNFTSKDLPSGTYFYKIKAGDFVQTKKMILLR